MSHMEKCSLLEALVLISNQFKDFAKQKAFLDELMASVIADWTSDDFKQCVLIPFICLHIMHFNVMTEDELLALLWVLVRCGIPPCSSPLLELIRRSPSRVKRQTQQASTGAG